MSTSINDENVQHSNQVGKTSKKCLEEIWNFSLVFSRKTVFINNQSESSNGWPSFHKIKNDPTIVCKITFGVVLFEKFRRDYYKIIEGINIELSAFFLIDHEKSHKC